MDFGRALMAGLTGGASEAALHVAEEVAERKAQEQAKREQQQKAQAQAAANQAAGTTNAAPAAAQIKSCCRYQIVGDFLLDAENGAVWRYDSGKKEFAHVPREKSAPDKSMAAVLISLTKDDVLDHLNDIYWKSPDARKPGLRKAIDLHSKTLDDELKRLTT